LSTTSASAASPGLRLVVKDVFIYGAGDLVLRATAFITLPIYTRLLTPSEYGVWAFVTSAVSLLAALLILGGDSAYARYFFEAKTLDERQAVTSTWFAFLAAWSVGIVLVGVPFGPALSRAFLNTDKWSLVIILSLLTAPVTLLSAMLAQALRNEFRAVLFAGLNVASALTTVALGVLFVAGLGWGVTGLAAAGLVGAAVLIPPRVWAARHLLRPVFAGSLLGRLLRYGVPLVPATIAWWIFDLSDRIVLGKLSTLSQVGLYSVANGVTSLLAVLVGSLGQAWSPHAFKLYEERPAETSRLFGRMLTYILVAFGVLAVGITTFAHELLSVLADPKYGGAARAVGPLALALVAYASIQVTASGISIKKKTGYLALFAWLAALLNLGLNLAFVGRYGMMASAWATLASYAFLTVGYFLVTQRLWPVSVERRKALLALAATGGFTVAAPHLPDIGLAASVSVKVAYVVGFVALLVALQVVDRQELAAARAAVRRFLPTTPRSMR
jgi:O-antigen/teichoic acid export membrane protein